MKPDFKILDQSDIEVVNSKLDPLDVNEISRLIKKRRSGSSQRAASQSLVIKPATKN